MLKKKRSIYDTTPPDDVFAEVHDKAVAYWRDNFSDEYGYVTGKVDRINGIANHDDNYLFILNMFSTLNEKKCLATMNKKTRTFVHESKKAKGYPIML